MAWHVSRNTNSSNHSTDNNGTWGRSLLASRLPPCRQIIGCPLDARPGLAVIYPCHCFCKHQAECHTKAVHNASSGLRQLPWNSTKNQILAKQRLKLTLSEELDDDSGNLRMLCQRLCSRLLFSGFEKALRKKSRSSTRPQPSSNSWHGFMGQAVIKLL